MVPPACCRKGSAHPPASLNCDPSPVFASFGSPALSSFVSGLSAPHRQSTGYGGQNRGAAFPLLVAPAAVPKPDLYWSLGPRIVAVMARLSSNAIAGRLSRAETMVGSAREARYGLRVSRPSSSPRNRVISDRADLWQRCGGRMKGGACAG